MKPKTTREVIAVLKDHIQTWKNTYPNKFGGPPAAIVHDIACLQRAIAIVRASRKWRAKK